jgi:glycerophosphoryl diester phosphodiesterase
VRTPVVIAHRGASGERPEHTASAYRLAIAQGADAAEPDLVLSRDGVLVIRHEGELSGTTDVAMHAAFADRKTTKTIDGREQAGWFAEDFTLAELKALRCRERLPHLRPASAAHDGAEPMLTFDDLLDLVGEEGRRVGRTIGVYAEIKHAGHYDALGLSHDLALLAALRARGLETAAAPVFLQSFEIANLRRLAQRTRVRLVQLIAPFGGPPDAPDVRYAQMLTDAGLAAIAGYAQAISVEKSLVVPRAPDRSSLAATDLIARAHGAGLAINAWTFRPENMFLPAELRAGDDPAMHGDFTAELRQHFALGLDGAFCDFPASAVAARDGP